MQIADAAVPVYFEGTGMAMARYYNPYTKIASSEKGSIWMYTSAIEAVNAIMHALKAQQEHGNAALYDAHFERYKTLLRNLYENADYYKGTFTLTSYTQTRSWSVYGVNRASGKGGANVACKENVYDDQEWFVREMIEAYRLTNDPAYLEKAEYLTDYVLDGWYRIGDGDGGNYGGIPWGPGYTSKHTCSNGPMISPLVWLYEIYKNKGDQITYKTINADGRTRTEVTLLKSEYYLQAAKMLYRWTKEHLLRGDGLYHDATWTDDPCGSDCECDIPYATVDGVRYRRRSSCTRPGGDPLTYNMGTPLSGAADLYRVTGEAQYLTDAKALADKSFAHFAKKDVTVAGLYTWNTEKASTFNIWFNGVLMRAYVDIAPSHPAAATYFGSFQDNLDYAYDHFFYNGFLPINLLVGWNQSDKSKNNIEGMFTFAYAAEYATLARHILDNE
jgi:predicted alpha-1,6-mannanase (GH76 family)